MSSQDNIGKPPPKADPPTAEKIDVAYVAKLARLALSDEEIKRLGKQLSDILGYIDKLNQINTDTTEPTSHALPLQNVERDDEVKPSLPIDETLKNAPLKEGNFFKVPKVIE